MADKDITLRIRAKDTSKQTFDQLTRTMERLSKAMEEQRDAAKKGDASVRDLENSYSDLEKVAKAMLRQVADVKAYENQARALDEARKRAIEAARAQTAYAAKLAQQDKVLVKEQKELARLTATREREERAVQKQIELETQIAREEELSRQAEGPETEGPREEITDKNSEEVQKLASEEKYSENEEIMDQEPEAAGEIEEKMDQEEEDAPESEEEQPEETYAEPEDDTEMDLDAFANYACDYARSIDCSLKDKSMLALYERIEIMEEDGIPLTKANAEALIEEAADKAEKPSLGKRIKGLFSSKYDKDGLLILKEEHFI